MSARTIRKALEKREDLLPTKPRKAMNSTQLEHLAHQIYERTINRAPPLKKKPKKKRKKSKDSEEYEDHRYANVDNIIGEQLYASNSVVPRNRNEIQTFLGSEEQLQPELSEQLLREDEKPFKMAKKKNIEAYLRARYGKKKKKDKKDKSKSSSGANRGNSGRGFEDDGKDLGGSEMEDVRYTVKDPNRIEYRNLYPQYSQNQHQGEGFAYHTTGGHSGNYNPVGSLNPPINYDALQYTSNFPLGPHRNSNTPWQEPGPFGAFGIGGCNNCDSRGGNQEGPYFPGGAKNIYYQIDNVSVDQFKPMVERTASMKNPYQLNNVSQPVLLEYPPPRNKGPQGFGGFGPLESRGR